MGNRVGVKVLFAVLLVASAIGAGMYGYNVGVAQGIAQSAAAAAQTGAQPTPVMFYPRPWGFGFGFFPFAPLFFIAFWILIFRCRVINTKAMRDSIWQAALISCLSPASAR